MGLFNPYFIVNQHASARNDSDGNHFKRIYETDWIEPDKCLTVLFPQPQRQMKEAAGGISALRKSHGRDFIDSHVLKESENMAAIYIRSQD